MDQKIVKLLMDIEESDSIDKVMTNMTAIVARMKDLKAPKELVTLINLWCLNRTNSNQAGFVKTRSVLRGAQLVGFEFYFPLKGKKSPPAVIMWQGWHSIIHDVEIGHDRLNWFAECSIFTEDFDPGQAG